MGHEAAVTKKRVLSKVEQCVEAANLAVSGVEELRDKHNAFTQKASDEFAARDARLLAQGEWLQQHDDRLTAAHQRLTDAQGAISVLDGCVKLETERLTDLYIAVSQLRIEFRAFTTMTFWQRLRYALTGRWPRQPRPGEGLHAIVAAPPTSDTYAGIDASATPMAWTPLKGPHA